jgi:hypothetical protein
MRSSPESRISHRGSRTPHLARFFYQLRNWRAHARAFFLGSYIVIEGALARTLNAASDRVRVEGALFARVVRSDGSIISLGCLGRRVVTTAGVNYMRDDFAAGAGSADISNFKYHDSGIGTGAEAIGDTALGTAAGPARVAGTQDNSVAKTYTSVATIPYTATKAITEHGLFSASTSGTLWDRTVFAAINVVNGDSIQFTYTLTISDGG